jgi:hypothetical protein
VTPDGDPPHHNHRGGNRVPADAGRGLGQLVMALLEILRELLERQVLRRMESGSLTPDEVERLGQALISLQQQFTELREVFGIDETTDLHLPVELADLLDDRRSDPS